MAPRKKQKFITAVALLLVVVMILGSLSSAFLAL